MKKVHAALPKTRIHVIGVKPSVSRWDVWPASVETNVLLKAIALKDDLVDYIDVATTMLGSSGDTGTSIGTGTTGLETGTTAGSTGDTDTDTDTGTSTSSSSTTGGGLGEGEICQDQPDACAPGLLCCYPCGVPDCLNKCIKPDPQTMMCPLFP